MTGTPDISVVVCAYTPERWDDLLAAVGSLRAQTAPARELIVVVDHNPALLSQAQAALTGCIVLANDGPRGLSGARNSGVAAASGAVVAFLDDDALAAPDWLARLGTAYLDPQVLGTGGRIVARWDQQRPNWFPEEFDWVVGCTYRGTPTAPAAVRNLIGANMSFRRAALLELGGFRDGLGRIGKRPLGCEETELCIRARQRWPNAVLRYDPQAAVSHRVPAARASWRYFRARCYAEGLSKAAVTRLVGPQDGLASERTYTMRTLPAGVLRGLSAALHGQTGGAQRAASIVGGLAITSAGYLVGRLSQLRPAQRPAAPPTAAAER